MRCPGPRVCGRQMIWGSALQTEGLGRELKEKNQSDLDPTLNTGFKCFIFPFNQIVMSPKFQQALKCEE